MSKDVPDHIGAKLNLAREEARWHAHQSDAAALCFEVLAEHPDCVEASDLVAEIFRDPWTIYENRKAIQRMIDEWDDRPHQHRRRLALSFRYMSQPEWMDDDFAGALDGLEGNLGDVNALLQQGKLQLLEAYCLGDEECVNYAWPAFMRAVGRAANPIAALWWIGRLYADLGFFADAVEVLGDLCSRAAGADIQRARRLLAEVRWWRDNAHRVPWVPPPGDGSRYRRIMAEIEPDAPSDEEVLRQVRARMAQNGQQPTWQPTISPALARWIEQVDLPGPAATTEAPTVDWRFLDGGFGDGDVPDEDELAVLEDMPASMRAAMLRTIRWRHRITPPATPPRHHPDDVLLGGAFEDDGE